MSNRDIVLRALKDFGVAYALAEHAPVSTMKDCAVCEALLGAVMPRNIFLCTANRKSFALLLCRPEACFRTSSVSKQANLSRLSFAPEEEIRAKLGAYPGAVSPLGLIFDVRHEVKLLMDKTLFKEENLLFHPLDNACSVRVSTQQFTGEFLKRLGYTVTPVDMEQIDEKRG